MLSAAAATSTPLCLLIRATDVPDNRVPMSRRDRQQPVAPRKVPARQQGCGGPGTAKAHTGHSGGGDTRKKPTLDVLSDRRVRRVHRRAERAFVGGNDRRPAAAAGGSTSST